MVVHYSQSEILKSMNIFVVDLNFIGVDNER